MFQNFPKPLRALRANPGLATAVIVSLGLGIGANTAIFSLIDALMLRPLPVRDPSRLVQVTMGREATLEYFTNPVWEQLRDRQDVFSGMFAYAGWKFNLANGGEAHYVKGGFASGQFFDALGVMPARGRTFSPADDKPGCPGAAVLSYDFWQKQYGGRADVIGRAISLDNHSLEIVGVTQPGFTGISVGASFDVLVPLCAERLLRGDASILSQTGLTGWLRVMGRLKPGITPVQARARLATLAPGIFPATVPRDAAPADRAAYLARTFELVPASTGVSWARREYSRPLLVLMAIVALVLLIACANIANLLLARDAARRREMAIRMALGCGRARLIRELLAESLLLSTVGAVAGVVLAVWGTRLLTRFLDIYLDRSPDLRMLAFTAGITVATALLFGVVPALRSAGAPPEIALRSASRGIAGERFRAGKLLVVVQVALALLLTVGAGLMLSTFWRLAKMDPGFDRDRVLLMSLDIRNGRYTAQQRLPIFEQVLEKLRAIPGVRAASASNITPIGPARWNDRIVVEGGGARSRADASVSFNEVSDRYFATLGTPLIAGRDFSPADRAGSPGVVIVNRRMAKQFFGDASPLGKRVRMLQGDQLSAPFEIVGVVKDAKYGALREPIPATVYTSWRQDAAPFPMTNFELRPIAGSPAALIPAVRAAVASLDPAISFDFSTVAADIAESLTRERLLALLSVFFGGLALLLAVIGLYSVMSWTVARRQAEIGIRMALGAERTRVLRMILAEIGVLIGAGLGIGAVVALAAGRFLGSLLYGVRPNDPLTFAAAVAVLAGSAACAGYLPARRAAHLDPMAALRDD